MSDKRITLDTNILVYALDRGAGERHVLASQIIARSPFVDCWLTLQSISEFYTVVSRKRLVSAAEAADQARDWLAIFPSVAASASAVRTALDVVVGGQMAYWDALLIATAAEAGCTTILTEDMGDGSLLHGVLVLNPFADDGLAPAAETLLTAD
jgi:predicted nucleic acid-binding protein